MLLFFLAVMAFGVAVGGVTADARECGGAALLTWKPAAGGRHVLSMVTLSSGHRSQVATLPFEINAIGYSNGDDTLFGLASGDANGRFADPPHLVSVDGDGRADDLGAVRGTGVRGDGLAGSYAGTVYNGQLAVLSDTHVVFIDIDRHPGTITRRTTMDVPLKTLRIGDVTTLPHSSKLYGLSTTDGSLVSIDPATGAIGHTPVAGLPRSSLVGAMFASPRGEIFGVVNGVDGRARLYRVSRDDSRAGMRAVQVADWPELTSADAAFCAAPTPHPRPSPGS
ncbi:MAG TPA: hypothetical protein VE172_15980, partial [Stackebrandtia sp.]|uniref:DUF6923 family protein n=1 Tax=Stackebrandtia sp. TaxID=2023065 RepID=UPI002D5D913C